MTSCNFILLLKAVSKCTHAEGWSFGMGFGGLHFISDSVKLLGFLPLLRMQTAIAGLFILRKENLMMNASKRR
ncbi:hypothetical protein LEMLEM_LOCUS21676 [Lemmus lemmus]